MKKHLHLLVCFMLFIGSSAYLTAQDYVGSDACMNCHTEKYTDWAASGHPYKFNVIENNQPPVYPPEVTNFQDTWMTNLGDGTHTYADVAGVIGGYGWKARFVGTDGHIIGTAGSSFPDAGGGHNQFNFYGGEDHGWVDYHPGDVKIYNYSCFKCHTTGGDTTGSWLTGVADLGTFTESGIGCESCHGPGGDHINGPSSSNIDKVYEFAHKDNALGGLEIDGVVQTPDPNGDDVTFLCGTCHNRDYQNPINASGGFIKHHEQWDEFVVTDHSGAGFTCLTCHNPHKRVIWDGDGITKACAQCHNEQIETVNHSSAANCIDCHMPFAAKSGAKRGESGFKGDVRSHLFKITVDTASMFTADGKWVKDDAEREASLSPAYSCLGCHNNDPNDNIPDKTLEEAVAGAKNMHEPTFIIEQKEIAIGVFPNPSFGATNITFSLAHEETVSLEIYNVSGQMVYTLENINRPAGNQMIHWNGNGNTGVAVQSGYYFIKVSGGQFSAVQKILMMN